MSKVVVLYVKRAKSNMHHCDTLPGTTGTMAVIRFFPARTNAYQWHPGRNLANKKPYLFK